MSAEQYLVVFCGFSFVNGPLCSIELLDLIALSKSAQYHEQSPVWQSLGNARNPCWSPLVSFGVTPNSHHMRVILMGGQNSAGYLDEVHEGYSFEVEEEETLHPRL